MVNVKLSKEGNPKAKHQVVSLKTPLKTEDIENLEIGTIVCVSGVIYTSRDSAHKRMVECLEQDKPMPIDVKGQIIYYVGPTPTRPGQVIGSCGPTTSYRMDPYTPTMLAQGMKGMIGKGPRSQEVIDAIVKYKGIYLAAVGGAAALISKCVKRASVVAYEDLGPEAIYRLEVEDFPCIVAIDCKGNNLYEVGKKRFQVIE